MCAMFADAVEHVRVVGATYYRHLAPRIWREGEEVPANYKRLAGLFVRLTLQRLKVIPHRKL